MGLVALTGFGVGLAITGIGFKELYETGLTPKHRVSGTSVRGKSAISKIGSAKLRLSGFIGKFQKS